MSHEQRYTDEIKTLAAIPKQKEGFTCRPAPQESLKPFRHKENNRWTSESTQRNAEYQECNVGK